MAGNALTAFSSFSNFASSGMNAWASLNIQDGQEKARTFQLDFSNALNDKMLDFSQRSDYENFDEELDNLYEEYRAIGNTEDKGHYASKLINDYLDNSYQESKYKVKGAQVQALQNDINNNAEIEVNKIITSNMDVNEAAKAIIDIRDGQLANNTNGQNTHRQYLVNTAANITTLYKERATNLFTNVLNSTGSKEEAEKAIKDFFSQDRNINITDVENFKVDDYEGTFGVGGDSGKKSINDLVDFKSIENEVLNNLEVQWKTKVKAIQDNNANDLSVMYANIITSDLSKWPDLINEYGRSIQSMDGYQLSDEERIKHTKLYAGLQDDIAKNGDKTTSSGNSQVKVDTNRVVMKNNMPLFVNALKMDNFDSIDEAKEALALTSYNDYKTSMSNAGYDMSKYTYNDFMTETLDILDSFVTEAKSAGYVPSTVADNMKNGTATLNYIGELAGLKADKNGNYSEAEIKTLLESKGIDFENEMTRLKNVYFDIVVETDFNEPDAVKTVNDKMKNLVGSILVSRIDNKRNQYKVEKRLGVSEDESIAQVANALSKDEAATTINDSSTLYGGKRESIYANGLEEERANYTSIFSSKIKEAVGGNVDLVAREEYTTRDVNPNPIFTDRNTGDEYRITSDDGKTYNIMKKAKGSNDWQKVEYEPKKEQSALAEVTSDKVNAVKKYFDDKSTAEEITEAVVEQNVIPVLVGNMANQYDRMYPVKAEREAKWAEVWNKMTSRDKRTYLQTMKRDYPNRWTSLINTLNN